MSTPPVAAWSQNVHLAEPLYGAEYYDEDMKQNLRVADFVLAGQQEKNCVMSGIKVTAGAGLTVNWAAGSAKVEGVSYPITASSGSAADNISNPNIHLANYIYINTSGVVSIGTSLPTTGYVPLAVIFTNAGNIVKIVDCRRINISYQGAAVASASSCNIWADDGDSRHITGAITINNFTTAPHIGAVMRCIADAAFTLVHSTALDCPGQTNIVCAAGDTFEVYAETTTNLKVRNYTRQNGKAVNSAADKATTAGDTLYATAAGILTRLGITAANMKLFSNAAGTAPEWAVGFKSGGFSKLTADASGSVSYTGIGFKPKGLIVLANVPNTPEVSIGIVFAAENNFSVFNSHNITANAWNNEAYLVNLVQGIGVRYIGYIQSWDDDGFTITWTKTGSKTGVAEIYYLAFR